DFHVTGVQTCALPILVSLCKAKNGAFLYASNFSLGVNILFELNRQLAKLMSGIKSYQVQIEEIHHTEKLDKPSGTAITLANTIIENHTGYNTWKLDAKGENSIPVYAKRIKDVPGTHTLKYSSSID